MYTNILFWVQEEEEEMYLKHFRFGVEINVSNFYLIYENDITNKT